MKRHIFHISGILLLLLHLCSCAKVRPDTSTDRGNAVRWNMSAVSGYATRALVDSVDLMERACTPKDVIYTWRDGKTTSYGLGESIGIWADYTTEIDGETQTAGNVFAGIQLFYNPNSTDTGSRWEYLAEPAYWVLGGKYVFRAYYPRGSLNINRSLSSAKSLVIEINTAQTQRDVLLSYNSYDTVSGIDAYGHEKSITEPVDLNFRHAMSAIRFIFKFYDGDDGVLYTDDRLTACWMASDEDGAMAITGYMIYGDGTDDSKEGFVQWRKQYSPAAGVRFYDWQYPKGVEFSNTENAGGGDFDRTTDQTVATAYCDSLNADGSSILHGKEFTRHNGWLMLIPQESTGKVRLRFQTERGGDAVFSVLIPALTGTSRAKYESSAYDPDKPTAWKDALDPAGTDFVPGWRYTYTISISKTDAAINLGIAPWNRLDSSFDIKFQ